MLNKDQFQKGMMLLMAAFPEYQCTPDTLDVYWEDLKDFDNGDFEKVITNHRRTSKFFPKICELRDELVRLKGFNRPTAAQAWEKCIKDAEAGKEEFEGDEVTARALAAVGGWKTFSFTPFKDLAFRFRDFERTYNQGMAQQDRQVKIGGEGDRLKIVEQKKLEDCK